MLIPSINAIDVRVLIQLVLIRKFGTVTHAIMTFAQNAQYDRYHSSDY